MTFIKAWVAACLLLSLPVFTHAAPLMRYPTASKTAIAFVAYNDLWTVPLRGGRARRLVHDDGVITTPLFSPDGRWIAYTARHGGLHDVFVLKASGGQPQRLTFEASRPPDGAMVVAWTPDSQRVVFLSHRGSPVAKLVRAFSVPLTGGMPEQLPLDRAGRMSFAPGGREIAYNRIFRNLELRKRYLGGQAQDVYIYNLDTHALKRVTDWKGTDTSPMWFGRKIYFVSDRGPNFRQNLWCLDLDSSRLHQVTHFADYDVDWPSLSSGTITFQQGGRLFAVALPAETLREVQVRFPVDQQATARPVAVAQLARVTDVMGGIDYAISPHEDAVLLSARGDIFRVSDGAKAQNLTSTPGADEDHPSWSPDGNLIAYASDSSGSQQLAVRPAAGGPERTLTHFATGYIYTPLWSPRGDSLVVADANHSLWWMPLAGGSPQKLATDPYAEIRDAAFSPDGRWVAYSTMRPTQLRAVHLHELASGHDTVVSSPMESDRSPVFTPDGRYLVFVSQRHEQMFVSDRDDENLISSINSDGLYAVALRQGDVPLTSPQRRAESAASSTIRIDVDGMMKRAVPLPVVPASITALAVGPSSLFYQTQPIQLLSGALAGGKSELHTLDLSSLKDKTLLDGLDQFSLSGDGARIAFHREDSWYVASTSAAVTVTAAPLSLASLMATVDPAREWAEMFEKAWRLDRDVFFNPTLNGNDWQAVHDAYARLVPCLRSQDDFLYLLGQMQGEIASSHTFLDWPPGADPAPAVPTGLLGVDYALDAPSGRYRFARIYRGDPTRPAMRGPLGEPGLAVHEGDYLLAVNGKELQAPADPDALLAGLVTQVTLTVASTPTGPRREVKVLPLTEETRLRRHDWIEHNREEVERLSGGRLGYVFLTNFHAEGEADFLKQFYPQRDKDGLIFDVRWNGGGFTSQSVLDVLRRERAGVFLNREGAMSSLPTAVAPRVMVALTNYGSASDGDQFPYFFQAYHLGKVVGERTWGGVQGINGGWTLMDGTSFTIPKDALASVDGQWVIENVGTVPDIAVEPRPDEALTHRDSELETAVSTALEELGSHPPRQTVRPKPLPAYPPEGNVPGASFGETPQ